MISIYKLAFLLGAVGLVILASCLKEVSPEATPKPNPPLQPVPEIDCTRSTARPEIKAKLILIGSLSVKRAGLAIASNGDKLFLAGGFDPSSGQPSSRVDIYDFRSTKWSTAELLVPRYDIATANSGNKIFFAGGYNGDDILGATYPTVDIYDASANTWSSEAMSKSIGGRSAAILYDKIYFAGGNQCWGIPCRSEMPSSIDIYDPGSNSWSTAQLSEGREGLSAVSAGDKLYFAGGLNEKLLNTNKIDIYNGTNSTWDKDTLTLARGHMASISAGNKIFFAGGTIQYDPVSNLVDIIDVKTQTASTDSLFQPNAWFTAVLKDHLVIFFTGAEWVPNLKCKFDIYDLTSNSWFIGVLNQNIAGASIISVNNTIYIAGGYVNGVLSGQVWKLEF